MVFFFFHSNHLSAIFAVSQQLEFCMGILIINLITYLKCQGTLMFISLAAFVKSQVCWSVLVLRGSRETLYMVPTYKQAETYNNILIANRYYIQLEMVFLLILAVTTKLVTNY